MVADPAEYPWSSYHKNALGKAIELITPHEVYQRIGKGDKARQKGYRQLFENQLSKRLVDQITESTLTGWVLGNDYFKQEIEKQANRRVTPMKRGGDRKSEAYRKLEKNQLF